MLAGTGVPYYGGGRLTLIAGLAVVFGSQNATARQFGVPELSTTVLTQTIVGIGFDSRLAGGTGQREKLRYGVILTMCGGAVLGATLTLYRAPVIAIAAARWRSASAIVSDRRGTGVGLASGGAVFGAWTRKDGWQFRR